MSYPQIYLGIIILASIVTGLLFVLFGQVTVRKLRKKAKDTNQLGIELASGWDILNVAGALSTPKWLRDKFTSSRLSGLNANYQFIYSNTNKFDRILGRVFWIFYFVTGFFIILYTLSSIFGFLD
jgi:hypothetical protein